MARPLLALALLLVLVGACDDPGDGPAPACTVEARGDGPYLGAVALDVLFIVDRSPSMADQDAQYPTRLRELAERVPDLERWTDLGADLHVAVVSSDLGATGVPGCTEDGDRARFVDGGACGIDGRFLRDDRAPAGLRDRNYAGTTADALACLLELPPSTCPVSQPLAAVVRALDGAERVNDGFRRSHAVLAIYVITDGDDCSLVDPAALAEVAGAADVEAAVDFACFARGVVCDEADPAAPGHHTGCRPRADGGLVDVAATLEQLQSRFARAGRPLMVGVLGGGADATVAPGPALDPTCTAGATAGPAPRLRSLVFPEWATHVDICDGNWGDLVQDLHIKRPLHWFYYGYRCFDPAIDLEPLVPGLQAECTGELIRDDGSRALLSWCSDPDRDPSLPCLRPNHNIEACPQTGGMTIKVDDAEAAPVFGRIDLHCAVACEP
ncbi:MAG TPA: hypothetical protein VM734_24470 [Kofleriaceae bacterium]|nr:hypothetical protein [Kofleriaceae bacterium]